MKKYIDAINNLSGTGEAGILLNDLSYFEGMDSNQIVTLFVENGAGQDIVKNLHKLQNLTLKTAKFLKERGAGDSIKDNLNSFKEEDREEVRKLISRVR